MIFPATLQKADTIPSKYAVSTIPPTKAAGRNPAPGMYHPMKPVKSVPAAPPPTAPAPAAAETEPGSGTARAGGTVMPIKVIRSATGSILMIPGITSMNTDIWSPDGCIGTASGITAAPAGPC